MSDESSGEIVAEFSVLEDAAAVTADDEDTVSSSVDNGYEPGSTVEDEADDTSFELPEYVAACRYCQRTFETDEAALEHEWNCDLEPTGECRFCGGTHIRKDVREDHFYACSEAQEHERKLKRGARARTMRGQDTTQGVSALRKYLLPQEHEFSAYLKWDDALSAYFGLVSLYKMHDFEEYGRLRTGFDYDGDEWSIEFGYADNPGLAVPDDDADLGRYDWRLEDVPEFTIHIYPGAYQSFGEAKADNRKRAYFRVRPRWPGVESKSGQTIPNPHGILGVDVETRGSYFEFTDYPTLLYQALDELHERQTEFGWSSFTEIRPETCSPENIHKSSNITDAELYVRGKKGETGGVFAIDGTLHRLSMILGRERRGYAKSVRDDRKCRGYYHTATICAMRAAEVVGGHELPKEFKHYHVRNPDAVEGTVLENPKIGVSYQNSLYDDTLRFNDVDRLYRELDEALLNVLNWSDLPTTPDHQKYVADDYFEADGEARMVKVIENQLPRIAQQQDDEIRKFAVAGNMNETDVALVDELVTDGGNVSPADLADRIGKDISTVYSALKRLGELVIHEYGHVELASKHIANGIVEHIESAKRTVECTLEEAAADIIRADTYGESDDPWSHWLRHWVRNRKDGEYRERLELAPQKSRSEIRRLIRSGVNAWSRVTGNPQVEFAREFEIEATALDTSKRVVFQLHELKSLFGSNVVKLAR
ncbi:AsnC family protein [Haloferax sp. Atlit-47N]|nr:AsnC family protein [Haloferax sp. Atlit-47N]